MTRILIVDDEPGIRQSISTLLQLEDYDTASAGDGEAALQLVLQWAPDVVISDLQMPKMDGLQLLAAIRALPALNHVRFIILAGLYRQAIHTLAIVDCAALHRSLTCYAW